MICASARDGIPPVQKVRQIYPASKVGVLATSVADDEEFIAWAGIGISGYIESDASVELVAKTVLRLVAGETVFPRRHNATLLQQFGQRQTNAALHNPIGSLTVREMAVLELLDEGRSNKQIARDLAITSATVKNHVHNILTKLDVTSRGSAAAFVRRAAPTVSSQVGPAMMTANSRRDAQRELPNG